MTDADAPAAALGMPREQLGSIEVVLFGPRPSLEWIKPVLDTGPQDTASALALSVAAATAAVQTVAADMLRRGRSTLLFTTGGAAVEPHRDRAVSGIAYAAESACVRMLHDALGDEGVYAAQLTVVGPIGPGAGLILKHGTCYRDVSADHPSAGMHIRCPAAQGTHPSRSTRTPAHEA